MKRALMVIAGAALLALGMWSAVALGARNDEREPSTLVNTATDTAAETTGERAGTTTGETTGETEDTTTGETTSETEATTTAKTNDTTTGETGESKDTTETGSKVWLCHRTGSSKHPYHVIHISTHARDAHLRKGDVAPGANNSCPTTQPADAKTHGHGKGHGAKKSGHGDDENEAPEANDD
jgi:hypothetical protein